MVVRLRHVRLLLGLFTSCITQECCWLSSPNYALAYAGHPPPACTFAVLGLACPALTGGEALYADMGHFGRSAIY